MSESQWHQSAAGERFNSTGRRVVCGSLGARIPEATRVRKAASRVGQRESNYALAKRELEARRAELATESVGAR